MDSQYDYKIKMSHKTIVVYDEELLAYWRSKNVRRIVLDYNATNISRLYELRAFLANVHARTIIMYGSTNLVNNLLSNTFDGPHPGLFGAMIRNPHIHKLIMRNMEGTDIKTLKKNLISEEKRFAKNLITDFTRTKIRFESSPSTSSSSPLDTDV